MPAASSQASKRSSAEAIGPNDPTYHSGRNTRPFIGDRINSFSNERQDFAPRSLGFNQRENSEVF